MTNTLEQLKFDKYVKANQDSIVKLSESIDSNLELLNDACAACGEFFSKVRTINQSMSRAFESCNKSLLNETFNRLKDYDKLFKLGVFSNLTTAMQMFISAAQKLND